MLWIHEEEGWRDGDGGRGSACASDCVIGRFELGEREEHSESEEPVSEWVDFRGSCADEGREGRAVGVGGGGRGVWDVAFRVVLGDELAEEGGGVAEVLRLVAVADEEAGVERIEEVVAE